MELLSERLSSFDTFSQYLRILGNAKKSEFDKKIIQSKAEFFGLTSKTVKEIGKHILAVQQENQLLTFPMCVYYEVDILQGYCIAKSKKFSVEERQSRLYSLTKNIDNWAVCDSTVSALKPKKTDLDTLFHFARSLLGESTEFSIRFGIVIMLAYFLIDEWIDEVLFSLAGIECGVHYYVDMAVAWLLSKSMFTHKNRTLDFLENSKNINDFTYLKTLQKARESFRIDDSDKAIFLQMSKTRKEKRKG